MKLYEYAVIYHPKKKKDEEAAKSEVLVPVTTILAADEKEVAIRAARAIPAEYAEKLDQVEIAFRPF